MTKTMFVSKTFDKKQYYDVDIMISWLLTVSKRSPTKLKL